MLLDEQQPSWSSWTATMEQMDPKQSLLVCHGQTGRRDWFPRSCERGASALGLALCVTLPRGMEWRGGRNFRLVVASVLVRAPCCCGWNCTLTKWYDSPFTERTNKMATSRWFGYRRVWLTCKLWTKISPLVAEHLR